MFAFQNTPCNIAAPLCINSSMTPFQERRNSITGFVQSSVRFFLLYITLHIFMKLNIQPFKYIVDYLSRMSGHTNTSLRLCMKLVLVSCLKTSKKENELSCDFLEYKQNSSEILYFITFTLYLEFNLNPKSN